MMMVWLIDSRSRALTGKRFVWGWEDVDYPTVFRQAWTIVLNAEPWAGAGGSGFWEEACRQHDSFEEGQAVFRRFWAEYGWELTRFDEALLNDGEDGDVYRPADWAVKIPKTPSWVWDEAPWAGPPYQ